MLHFCSLVSDAICCFLKKLVNNLAKTYFIAEKNLLGRNVKVENASNFSILTPKECLKLFGHSFSRKDICKKNFFCC